MAGDTGESVVTAVSVVGDTISVNTIVSIGISVGGPLAAAAETGGGAEGGGHAGPVGVGVVQGGVGVAVVGVSISLGVSGGGSVSRGNDSAENLKKNK